jgi:protein MpaA
MTDDPESVRARQPAAARQATTTATYEQLEVRYRQAVSDQMLTLELQGDTWSDTYHKPPATAAPKLAGITTIIQHRFQAVTRMWTHIVHALKVHRTIILLYSGIGIAALVIGCTIYTYTPQTVSYAFSNQKNCIVNPQLMPNGFKTTAQQPFILNRSPTLSIGHTIIVSYRLCVVANSAPKADTDYTDHQYFSLAGFHLSKSVRIVTNQYPVASASAAVANAVPLDTPLLFRLNKPDTTFSYELQANGKESTCSLQQTTIRCSLTPLQLSYATSYMTSLVRVFHKMPTITALVTKLQTITATAITQTSISAGSIVYDTPQLITIQTSKDIAALQAISITAKNVGGVTTNIPITTSFSGETITIHITSLLPRSDSFDVHLTNLTADDQSTLENPYDLTFSTSGGPKVVATTMPSYGVASGQAITLTFDQALLTTQAAAGVATLKVNDTTQPASYVISGDHLIITPSGAYPVCATITLQVSNSIQSTYGVSGNSAYSYTTRAHCYSTFSIGTSVQGRPMTAYKFGTGASMVLYIGAMEGNEQNASQLLSQWIPDVDANPGKIPSYRTLVIIPTINPDGYAADTRLNAAGIDLNRNFPANNWQTQVTEPLANTVVTDDGGPHPLSAPESQALAAYYTANKPRLAITEHSHGGIVEANDAGDSIALGTQYASLADYKAIPTEDIGNFFDYTTTGAFEDWANNAFGLPVLEIELESATNDEYSRNLPALWAMAQVSP